MTRTLTPKTDSSMAQRLLSKIASVETSLRNRDRADKELRDALAALSWDLRAAKEMLHRLTQTSGG